MGCTPSIDVHVEADDVQDGDVVGCFCGGISAGCMGRIKNSPVPYILRAPTGKKKEIIKYSDIEKFKEIDDHALNVPGSALKSIKSLTKYLVAISDTDKEKVRSFFVWITANISYETSNIKGGGESLTDPNTVFRRRAGDAVGYCNLFATMCKSAGVPVVNLSGFAKRTDHDPEIPYTPHDSPDHAWNAVFVDDDWRFVDCCWGAGYEDETGYWVRKYEEFWFLTDPDKFINDHYPWTSSDRKINNNWQLLKQPITLAEYNKLVKLEEVAKEWGLDFSHNEPILIFRKEVHITITASILVRNITCAMETIDHVKMDDYTLVYQFDTLTYSVQARPPSPGTYVLRIYGKKDGEMSQPAQLLVKYLLKCTDVNNYVKSLPYVFTHAQTYHVTLHEPNSRELPARSKIKIRLSSQYLRQIMVENIPLECDEHGTWEGKITTPQSGDAIIIYGSTSDDPNGKFHSLYKFYIVDKAPKKQ